VSAVMLTRFAIANFKSFQSAELVLHPLTVLIGANASGKANLLEALQLLSWMASGRQLSQILSAIRDEELGLRGTLPQLTHESNGDVIQFDCTIAGVRLYLHLAVSDRHEARISYEEVSNPSVHADLSLYEADATGEGYVLDIRYNNFARGGRKPRIEGNALQPVFTQLLSGARFGANHKKSQRVIPKTSQTIADTLQRVLLLDPAPRRMRGYSHKLDQRLRSDGANLSAVLYQLYDEGLLDHVLEFAQALPEQDITAVSFIETERGEVMVVLEESFAGHEVKREAALLSDGTLRALAIAAALLSVEPGSTVIIEEVDNGIHPPRVSRILDLMRETAEQRGLHVLVTTHNPALLDAIPNEDLQHVVACYRDPETGDSKLVTLGQLERFPAARDPRHPRPVSQRAPRRATSGKRAVDAAAAERGMSATIVIIDTSVFVEILAVPGKSQAIEETRAELEEWIEADAALLLPMAVIIETGNHIAQVSNGAKRRRAAEGFVERVQEALDARVRSSRPRPSPSTPCGSGCRASCNARPRGSVWPTRR
jgi:ABC-type cobalamin/Fe3+-siderophores transport system ATPase subunit